jgi:hypothetical protein
MRLLNSLFQALRDIHASNEKIAEAICANTASKKEASNGKPPTPFSDSFPEAVTAYYISEQKERPSNNWWKKFERVVAALAFLAALGAAIFTGRSLQEITRQADTMEAENRPWIKITNIELIQDNIPTLSFPTSMPPPITNGLALHVKVQIKNVGHGVARGVVVQPMLVFERLSDTKDPIPQGEHDCEKYSGYAMPEPFTFSGVFPNDERAKAFVVLGGFAQSDINHITSRSGDYLIADLITCVGYQSPRPYITRTVSHVMGRKDRFIEIGSPLNPPSVSLLRDEGYDYAQ